MLSLPDLVSQAVLGFGVTFGFAVLFNVPRAVLFQSSAIGAAGHVVKVSLQRVGFSTELATFCGAFIVGLVGYLAARRFHVPRLIFTVTGIISMVPGIPAYEAIIYLTRGDMLIGLQSAVRASLIIGAIATGLSTARLITEHREYSA
jgi:uncharacterized membrane protein YjjB (DUF3815 family)